VRIRATLTCLLAFAPVHLFAQPAHLVKDIFTRPAAAASSPQKFAQLPNDPAIQTVTLPTSLHAQLINARSEVGHENVAGLFWTATDLERKLVEFQQYYTSIARMRVGRAPAGAEPGPDRRSGESPRL